MVIQDATTVVAVAVALGTDAFSVALGFGIARVVAGFRLRFIGMVALLHVLMPLIGLEVGLTVGKILGVWAARLGALVLVYVAYDMVRKGIKGQWEVCWEETKRVLAEKEVQTTEVGLVATAMLGLSVSMDALTVGFGLGTAEVPIGVTVAVMGVTAGLMTAAGFWGGRWLGKKVGQVAQTLGGCVLLLLALKMVL